jgi:N-acetylmuramoyl-L-alanine amidase
MKRWFSGRCAVVLVCFAAMIALGTLLPAAPVLAYTHTFTDIGGSESYADAALSLADDGVFYPQASGAFGPYDAATRADLAVYLTRLLHLPLSSALPFSDISQYAWYAGYVAAMYEAGLISGTSATTFSPDLPVSRQQAATLLMRSLEYFLRQGNQVALANFSLPDDQVAAWLVGFRDRTLIAPGHQASVANACRFGVMQGGVDGWFYPAMTVTRAQVAVMLYRAFKQPLTASNVYPVEIPATASYAKLSNGSEGPLVLLLESRLAALHYPCGIVDTVYDNSTHDAVMAFEKVEGLPRDGIAGAAVWERVFTAQIPTPRLPAGGDRIEVDLSRQVLFVIRAGEVTETVHVSTGKIGTPTGHGKVWLKQEGWQTVAVGRMYYPSYFYPHIAIHGSGSVPPYPASHGCVRTPIWIAAHIYGEVPMGTSVDVYY